VQATAGNQSLETALAKTESDAGAVLKAASAVSSAVRRLRAAAKAGDLRKMRPTIAAAEQAIATLRQQFANAKDGWDFDEDTYFENGAFTREIRETAERLNVRVYEQDDRLYCYPSLIRLLANDRVVLIDKTRDPRLRPTVLVNHLKDLQKRPLRFKPQAFLESLFEAYSMLVAKRGKGLFGDGRVERLLEIYNLLTLLPDQSKEYARQEFARDIYLLDRSGVNTTRKGHLVSFPASSGTRAAGSTIRIITEHGEEKVYYGIAFSAPI
jgi:hypothetical protein